MPKKQKLHRQQGASLIFTLVAILILLSAAAVSMNQVKTQQSLAANQAMRQDMLNQADWVIAKIIDDYDNPSILTNSSIANKSINYSPKVTSSNKNGIPHALLMIESEFSSSYGTHRQYEKVNESGIKFRYFIERMCEENQPADYQIPTACLTTGSSTSGGSDNHIATLNTIPSVIYRINLRIDGPKNAQIFLQSTFTRNATT